MGFLRALILVAVGLAATHALALPIVSGDGNETCLVPMQQSCTVQTISLHRRWQTNDPNGDGAAWISYADTGALGSTLAVAPGGNKQAPVMFVRETLTGLQAGDRLVMDVWADDTSEVQLQYGDGSTFFGSHLATLLTPNFTQNTCADGANGCEPEDKATIDYTFTAQDVAAAAGGSLYLSFSAFQVGTGTTNATNPFGLLYSGYTSSTSSGQRTAADVPEPPVFGLLLATLGLFAARRVRAA